MCYGGRIGDTMTRTVWVQPLDPQGHEFGPCAEVEWVGAPARLVAPLGTGRVGEIVAVRLSSGSGWARGVSWTVTVPLLVPVLLQSASDTFTADIAVTRARDGGIELPDA